MTIASAQARAHHRTARQHAGDRQRRHPHVPVDIYRCDNHYVVLCDLPGVDPGTLDVQVDGAAVTIRGHRSAPNLTGTHCLSGERPLGAIERRVHLDQPADGRDITATYVDGVLTLTIPTTTEPQPRHRHDGRWPAHVVRATT